MSDTVLKEHFIKAYLEVGSTSMHLGFHQMTHRLMNGETAVLPIRANDVIFWLLLQENAKKAFDHSKEIQHFILPFCQYRVAEHRKFQSGKTPFQTYGERLFPHGYYLFQSLRTVEESIWSMLQRWIQLDQRRPTIRSMDTEVSAFTLRKAFQEYLATQQWDEAKRVLSEIREGHYVSNENYLFLTIQWLAAQQKWADIAHFKDFELIASLEYVPKRIKLALLHAYYQTELFPVEVNDQPKAFERFKETRYRLRGMLHSLLSEKDQVVMRLKAYDAAFEKNADALARLHSESADERTHQLIEYLLTQGEMNSENDITAEQRAFAYYHERRYDDSYHAWLACELSLQQVKFLSKIATMLESDEASIEAYNRFKQLSEDEQSVLMKDPECRGDLLLIQVRLTSLEKSLVTDEVPEEVPWHTWFEMLLQEGTSAEKLDVYLRKMGETLSGIVWNETVLQELTERLAELSITDLEPRKKALVDSAFTMFLQELTDRATFPDERALDLYDYSSQLMLNVSKKNPTTMSFFQTLSEGILSLDFTQVLTLWTRTKIWFNLPPSKVMIPHLQAALELYFDYGVPVDELCNTWNNWTGTLGQSLFSIERTDLESWYGIGQWLDGDKTLLDRIHSHLSTTADDDFDLLAYLPRCNITIFTLREETAKRAVERMTARNPKLSFTICTDDSLTTSAKAHAKNADLIVLVTTCLSHALFYGIQPYLKDNIAYPLSSGTTGIIRSVEDYFKKTLLNSYS